MPQLPTRHPTVVIGGGQAGLATAYHLKRRGLPYEVIDAAGRIGDSWRMRYDSLSLFTPRWMNSLPGFAMRGNRDGYPGRDEFADYLEQYAIALDLTVTSSRRVVRLIKEDAGTFVLFLDDGTTRQAGSIVVATGGFQASIIPALAADFTTEVDQLSADTFRNKGQLRPGLVLVVGDGASGRDIARECASTNPVLLSRGKPRKLLPEAILGKSVWWWLYYSGLLRAGPSKMIGRRIRQLDAFPDRGVSETALKASGIELVPRLIGGNGSEALFVDGTSRDIRTVIWSVGYRDDFEWIDIDGAMTGDGTVSHENGVSPVPGIYYVGRPWQRNRASALVAGSSPDAAEVVNAILRYTQ